MKRYIYTSVRDESTFEALLLQRSRSATPATFHSRGISAIAQCRFIVERLLDGLHPRSTSVIPLLSIRIFSWEPPSADEPSMHNGTHGYIDRRLSIMNHLTRSESGISEKREDDFPGSRVSRSCARAVIITPSSFATAKLVSGFFPQSREWDHSDPLSPRNCLPKAAAISIGTWIERCDQVTAPAKSRLASHLEKSFGSRLAEPPASVSAASLRFSNCFHKAAATRALLWNAPGERITRRLRDYSSRRE